ncbi:MAG: prepilin-type N-terminal cleavage/methylation domain-containing protein [Candidatus Sulfomarinibacteraceae bacterium]
MRRQKGFTLIELLIVVAIIGIIAAIAIPNLLNAINRSRQKRSMSDMRTIGTATEAYAVDWAYYPEVAEDIMDNTLEPHLSPVYIKKTPPSDGWREPFRAVSESRFYTIGSAGRDKLWEETLDSANYDRDPTTVMDCDIIYANGTFISYPEGVQTD